jgi:hypothetical protein
MKPLLKLLTLNKSDRSILLTAFILLNLVRVGLFFCSFSTLQELLEKASQLLQSKISHELSVKKIIWAVNTSSRYTPGLVKCLARALTTQTLMKSCGYSPQLQIGVIKADNGKLQAHAWIEHEGKVVIGNLSNLNTFVPMQLVKAN